MLEGNERWLWLQNCGYASALGARPETIEAGGKEGRFGVAESKRDRAQRVGLQRRPGPQVSRGLDDHYLAGWTSRAESELSIGGEEDMQQMRTEDRAGIMQRVATFEPAAAVPSGTAALQVFGATLALRVAGRRLESRPQKKYAGFCGPAHPQKVV